MRTFVTRVNRIIHRPIFSIPLTTSSVRRKNCSPRRLSTKAVIGRTLKINESRSLDSFTKVDIRHFDSVVIGQKKVTLVSSHPAGSYEFVQDEKRVYESLIIKDKRKFWEYSKVLVISYK